MMTVSEIDLEVSKAKEKQNRMENVLETFDKEFLANLSERITFLCNPTDLGNCEKWMDNLRSLHIELLSYRPLIDWYKTRQSDVAQLIEGLDIVENQIEIISKRLKEDKE
jgi:hypothetical protein